MPGAVFDGQRLCPSQQAEDVALQPVAIHTTVGWELVLGHEQLEIPRAQAMRFGDVM